MARLSPEGQAKGLARRALGVLLLWIGFWLIAAALLALLLYVPYLQVRYSDSLSPSGFIAAGAALMLVIALLPRGWGREDKNRAKPLPRDGYATLYAWVEDIGRRAGVNAPVEIYLGLDANASIGAVRKWHGGLKKLRVNLGMGLFNLLDEAQLGSVVAHEYGHFVGGDLRLGPWVYRLRNSIGQALYSLDSNILFLDAPFRAYGHWFMRRTALVSRAQEYSADALAGKLFGAQAAGGALHLVHGAGVRWSAYLDGDLWPAISRGARLPIRGGFEAFTDGEDARADVREAIADARARKPSPYDSHPLLDERLHALDAQDVEPGPAHCLHLLGGEAAAEADWYARVENERMPEVRWEDYGAQVLLPQMSKRFEGTFLSPQNVPLSKLPALLADTDTLWQRTRPQGMSFLSPQARQRYVHGILEEFAILGLSERGYCLTVRPGRYLALVGPDAEIRPDEFLKAAAAGKLPPEQAALLGG